MTGHSDALLEWRTKRMAALQSLDDIHGRVTEKKPGRQWNTEHFNLSMFVSLAAQFQGFCRDLHDEAAICLIEGAPDCGPLAPIFLDALIRRRNLDVGNAGPGNIGGDFAVFHMQFWPEVKAAYPTKGPRWNRTLEELNTLRNGVAHSDFEKLRRVRERSPLTLSTWRSWRRTLDGAASGFDRVVGAHLKSLADCGWR